VLAQSGEWREPEPAALEHALARADAPLSGDAAIPRRWSRYASGCTTRCGTMPESFVTGAGLARAARTLQSLRDDLAGIGVADSERAFNLTWHDALNLDNLIAVSRVIVAAASARENSRGAHYRTDFPDEGDLATSTFVRIRERDGALAAEAGAGALQPRRARRVAAALVMREPPSIAVSKQICQSVGGARQNRPVTAKLNAPRAARTIAPGASSARNAAPAARALSACGFANESGEKFCGGCGAALAKDPTRRRKATRRQERRPRRRIPGNASRDGERRPVTVLFADLVDYTRMSRALDPEDVHAMLERYYATADEIVERFRRKHRQAYRRLGDGLSSALRSRTATTRCAPCVPPPKSIAQCRRSAARRARR
jgi:hypothetical protein